MKMRIVAVSLIALPIASIIGGALYMRHASPVHANAQALPAPESPAAPASAARVSGRDPVAVRAVSRRTVPAVGRLVPLAQADDARRYR